MICVERWRHASILPRRNGISSEAQKERHLSDIASFLAGFERFQAKYFDGQDKESLYARLRQGQNPRALVISCCDSRVDPAMLTGADPGDMFVVRNVANLVPPYRNGAEMPGIRADIEFAVKSLNVERIIILGHRSCGGIQALMNGEGITENHYEFIGAWVSIARQARERVLRELPDAPAAVQAKACEQWAISLSLDNLMSFPWIRERVEAGTLTLHGWYFDIDTGDLLGYSAETSTFAPLVPRAVTNGKQ
jgi:carbonic anhydrase